MKTVCKRMISLVLSLALLCIGGVTTGATEAPYMTITIETVERRDAVEAGDEITLRLTASAAEQLNGLEIRVCFDETAFAFVDGAFQNTPARFDLCSVNDDPLACESGDAEVWFVAADIDGYANVSEGEVIATITLRALTTITEDEPVYSYYCEATSYDSTVYDYPLVTTCFDGGVVIASYMRGDVTLDGEINLDDATSLFYHINGLKVLTGDALTVADLTADGIVDLNDATRLFYFINGLI